MVLDFVNDADDIQEAFEPYYERTLLTEATDPNKLYDVQRRLTEHGVFSHADVDAIVVMALKVRAKQAPMDQLYAVMAPVEQRFWALEEGAQTAFRSTANDYVRLYAFLSQLLTFRDAELEKLYLFLRQLSPRIRAKDDTLPVGITENIDLESYRIQRTSSGKITLTRGENELEPMSAAGPHTLTAAEKDALSNIIKQLNDKFGTDFTEADHVFIRTLEERLAGDNALQVAVNTNPPDNARLTFDHKATDQMQDLVETDFKFYKRVNDDPAFARYFLDWLFDRYRKKENGAK